VEIIETLERVATECGHLVLALRNSAMDAEDKAEQLGAHFSTRADRQSQELGLNILKESLPAEFVVAEEKENFKEIPPNCTVFDPLDGTTIFFNGLEDFSVSLCTLREGKPAYAATYFPIREMLISAVRGEGCYTGGFRRGTRISHIGWHGALDKTLIGTDVGAWTVRQGTFDLVLRPLASRFNVVSPISATEGAREVLFGETGVFYNLGIAKIWDAAAMALAIEEAGGVACDPKGESILWNNINCDWIVAGNQELANIVLEHSRSWTGRI
jgi:fructose-1,6-bisphosphatase/inositol monophosphatase family enzyme